MNLRKVLLASAAAVLLAGGAMAQVTLPYVTSVGPTDAIQVIPNGSPHVGNVYATAGQISAIGSPPRTNFLIGGYSTTNLYQRGTAGVSTTSATPTYDSPDRWGQWAASSAGVKIAQDTTAGDLPTGSTSVFALTHTNTTGGKICMGQVIAATNAQQLAGRTVEFDAYMGTGAGYTGGNPTIIIATGTTADEGLTAFAGATWTGYAAATTAVVPLTGVSKAPARFAVVAMLPANEKEIGVSVCYIASTTDTTDYLTVDQAQLVHSPGLASFASATAAYLISAATPPFQAAPFLPRLFSQEADLQKAYFWEINETAVGGAAAGVAVSPSGQGASTTSCTVLIPTPTTMRAVPTLNFTLNGNAPSASTWTVTHVVTATVLSTPYLAASGNASTPNLLALTATTGATLTAGQTCILTTTAAGGGVINASAEL